MTEKQYGGATGRGTDKTQKSSSAAKPISKEMKKTEAPLKKEELDNLDVESNDNYIKAGKIASEVVAYARTIIKKGVPLLEIADKIEKKIVELKGKPAFPVNLSINEIAAHDTPAYNDERVASGLLKVDIGVHVNGCIADIAFSLDLEDNEENKKLIIASEKALSGALEVIKEGIHIREIGSVIDKTIKSFGFTPIHNLSGHSIEPYMLHSGITIPNFDNSQEIRIDAGVYAIEPFATSGSGAVRDSKPSGIYRLEKEGAVRDSLAREILHFIEEEYQTLPFCSRWICKKFGPRALIALRRIEESKLLHHYPQLIEISGKKVSQAEHTIIIQKEKKIITTA